MDCLLIILVFKTERKTLNILGLPNGLKGSTLILPCPSANHVFSVMVSAMQLHDVDRHHVINDHTS